MSKNKVQPKKKREVSKKERTLTPNEQAQNFLNEYQALCKKHQLRLVFTPAFKVSQDTGTWSVILQKAVGRLPR